MSPTRDDQLAAAHAHAAAEGNGDLAGTLGTLDPHPRFELLPIGIVLEGPELIQAYYEHFFAHFQELVAGFSLRSEWVTDEGLGQEYQIEVKTPDGQRPFDVIASCYLAITGVWPASASTPATNFFA